MNYGTQIQNAVYGAAQPGMGPGLTIPGYNLNPLNGSNFNILSLQVGNPTANPVLSIPASLTAHAPWTAADADTTRNFVFMPSVMGPTAINGPFMINNAHYDMDVINETVKLDNIEIWELRNQSPISHPFHIHNVQFYILSINGTTPPAHQRGRKDVVLVPAGNSIVRFITKFEDFYNDSLPYMYHCHMLTHEDDGMMGQFLVRKPCDFSINGPASQTIAQGQSAIFSVSVSDTTGVSYQWQENTGTGFNNLQNSASFSGVNSSQLVISNAGTAQNGHQYRCQISHPCRNILSAAALLTVTTDSTVNPPAALLLLYPNPSSDMVYITDHPLVRSNYRLVIFDAAGKKLREEIKNAGDRNFSVKEFPAGVYMIHLISGSNKDTRRLIKN
jgi:hypothetical protein